MKKEITRSTIDLNTKIASSINPDDALKLKLAVATRRIDKKEKSSLLANLIKSQIKADMK